MNNYNIVKIYKIAKKNKEKTYLTPEERKQVQDRFGKNPQCSFFKDDDGYYCYTHRARSKSYPSIAKIPKSKFEFIESTSSSNNRMIKKAAVEQDIRILKKDIKDLERKLKKVEQDNKKLISDLNLGSRLYFQQKTIFTSLQRKIEKFERVEQEWKKYKGKMDSQIKRLIEKKHRAQKSQ